MPKTITITVDDATLRAFNQRLSGHGLIIETVAQAMLFQTCHNAPPQVATFLAGQRGGPGNLYVELDQSSRAQQRAELADEVALANLIRTIATRKDRQ